MKTTFLKRSTSSLALLAILAVFSGHASALPFSQTYTGFANSGSLTIMFDGNPGMDNTLSLGEVTSFSASYTDTSPLVINWSGINPDLTGINYNALSGNLVSLFATSTALLPPPPLPGSMLPPPPPPPVYNLQFGASVTPSSGNLIEIFEVTLTGPQLAASVPLPPTGMPLPASALLLGLGLVLLRRYR